MIDAARHSEARVRVAALDGLGKLKRDDTTEALFRTAWANPKEAYGARQAALKGLVGWKVKDADDLLAAALKIPPTITPSPRRRCGWMLETPGPKARELAVLYSRYGQPAGSAIHGRR